MEIKTFIVRKNCEFSMVVQASSEEEAIEKSKSFSIEEWNTAWSVIEAEEEAIGMSRKLTTEEWNNLWSVIEAEEE